MSEHELTLDDAVRILTDSNKLYKKGDLPLAIYCAHVAKDYFKDCGNELGISLCDDLINNGIMDIRARIITKVKKRDGIIITNRLERELATSEEVVELSVFMTSNVFDNLEEMQDFYCRLIKGDFPDFRNDLSFRNN